MGKKTNYSSPHKPTPGTRFRIPGESVGGDGSTSDCHPIFALTLIQKAHCLSDCTTEEKAAFADTLHKLSKLKWATITSSHRHGCGCEKIARDAIKYVGIPPFLTEETNLLAFRFYSKAALVGFRKEEVFYILWLDRDFTLYAH